MQTGPGTGQRPGHTFRDEAVPLQHVVVPATVTGRQAVRGSRKGAREWRNTTSTTPVAGQANKRGPPAHEVDFDGGVHVTFEHLQPRKEQLEGINLLAHAATRGEEEEGT
jgi:hypothetical protein